MGKKLAAFSTAVVALMGGLISNISPAMATDWSFNELWENKLKIDSEMDCNYDFECETNFYLEKRTQSAFNKYTRLLNEKPVMITAFNYDTGVMRIMFNNHNINEYWRPKSKIIPEKLDLIRIRWFYEGSEPTNFDEYFSESPGSLYYEARNSELIKPNQEVEIKMGEPIKDGKKLSTYHSLEYRLREGEASSGGSIARSALNCLRTLPTYEYGKECQMYYSTVYSYEHRLMWPDGMEPKEPETSGPTAPEVDKSTGSEVDGPTDPTDGSSSGPTKEEEVESGKGPEEESGDHDDDYNGNDLQSDSSSDSMGGGEDGNNYSGQKSENANNSGDNGKNGQLNGGINQALAINNSSNIANLSQIGAPNTGAGEKRDAKDNSTKQDFFGLGLFIATFVLLNLAIFAKKGMKLSQKAKK